LFIWLKPKAKGSFGCTKTLSSAISHHTVPECNINVQVQLLGKGSRKMEHNLYQVAVDAPFCGHKHSHSPSNSRQQPFVSTSSAEREELPEITSSQGSSTSAGIIIRMTCIALLVQNTLLGHFRLPLDMILLPFQSLNICPLLPVTLAQFNWAVTYILSIHFFYCCSQISRV